MINESNLNKLYEIIITKQSTTLDCLDNCGINQSKLSELIEDQIIERINNNTYKLKNITGLYKYGTILEENKEYDKALLCYQICYETNIQLYLKSIIDKNYIDSIKYLEQIRRIDINHIKDINLYLYLLNFITTLPKEYQEYVKSLNYNDILLNENTCNDIDIKTINKIRKFTMQQKFVIALNNINDLTNTNNINITILKVLLSEAIIIQNKAKIDIMNLLKKNKYIEISTYLHQNASRYNLSSSDRATEQLIDVLTSIIDTNLLPQKQVSTTTNLFEAINGQDYELALKLSEKYIKKNKIAEDENIIYMLLVKINELIFKINTKENNQSEQEDYKEQLLKSIIEKVYTNGIAIVPDIDISGIDNIKDTILFSVGNNENKKQVLRYRKYCTTSIDKSEVIEEANKLYNNGEYDLCIEKYKQLFSFKNVKTWVYVKIGLAYLKNKNIDAAIEYLTVANYISKTNNQKYDFTNLILELKEKQRQYMNSNYSSSDLENYYGIDINKIVKLLDKGIEIGTICEKLNFTKEQKNLVFLILARECYAYQNYTLGDKYFKIVERSENKTELIKKLLIQITQTKRFYKNRITDNHEKILVITNKNNIKQ